MKTIIINLYFSGLLLSLVNSTSAPGTSAESAISSIASSVRGAEPQPKQAAFAILKSKCNVCHKKQNPFKVFSLKNMDKHATKIYKQVFIYQRMPKGNEVRLSDEEYHTLKTWLRSTNNF